MARDMIFNRPVLEASTGNFVNIFPDDEPGVFREVYVNNQSGNGARFRSSDDTANTSAVFEIGSSGSFFFPAIETAKLQGRSLTTNAAAISFCAGMRQRPYS